MKQGKFLCQNQGSERSMKSNWRRKAIRSIDEAPKQAQEFETVKTMKDRESERTFVASSDLSQLIYTVF